MTLVVAAVAGGMALLSPRAVFGPGGLAAPTLVFDEASYVGGQIRAVLNRVLKPEVSFATVEFEPPFTARMTDARLVAPDGTVIIEAARFSVELAEPPQQGRPVRVRRVLVADGALRLVRVPGTGLVGFSDLIERDADKPRDPDGPRLSDVLVLERVDIAGLSVVYDPGGGREPLRFDGVRAGMDIQPAADRGPGWYSLSLASGRSPGLEIEGAGDLSLDTFDLAVSRVDARLEVSPQTVATLPGPVQGWFERHEARGRATLAASGTINLKRPREANATARLDVAECNLAFGEYRIPVRTLAADAAFDAGVVRFDQITGRVMDGSVRVVGSIDALTSGAPATADWTLSDIDLRQALRVADPQGQPPRLAGLLRGNGHATANLRSARDTIAGRGEIDVRDGRLVLLPGFGQLMALALGDTPDDGRLNHTGSAEFTISPTGLTITESEVITSTLAARGKGTVGFGGELDLRVNAGPLEKIQSLLGPIGSLLGSVTDRLVKYTIRGTTADPAVGVAPLGLD